MDHDIQIAGDPLALPHLIPPPPALPDTVAALAGLARAIAAAPGRWAHLIQYDTTELWYHHLHSAPGYRVWLLSWLPGQRGGPRGHGASSGVLTVLHGTLTLRPDRHPHRPGQLLTPLRQRVLPPGRAHDIRNDSLEPAVGLHLHPTARFGPARGRRSSRGARRDRASVGDLH